MKLIAGLGNPGLEHENTRHNVGFMAIDQFLKDFEDLANTKWQISDKFKGDIKEISWQRKKKNDSRIILKPLVEKIILLKPKTYMNNSGLSVSLVANFYKIPISDIWVLHDDVDFSIGNLKIKQGGASAGHRGVASIIESLNSDKFFRFRMGIGRPNEKSSLDNFVLDKFTHQDHAKLREMLKRSSKAITEGLENDLYSAMNKFNSK